MEKFDRVLNKEDEQAIIAELGLADILAAVARKTIQMAEQAAIAKYKAELAEQEPVAWVIDGSKGLDNSYVTQREAEAKAMISLGSEVKPLYAHPQSTNSAQIHRSLIKSLALKNGFTLKDEDLHEYVYNFANELASVVAGATFFDKSTKNHIADGGKMVEADHIPDASNMIWCACGDGFEPDTFGAGFIAARGQCQGCDAEDKSSVVAESQAKIIAASHRYADMRVAAALGRANEKDAAESYKALELRIAAELAITQESASETSTQSAIALKEFFDKTNFIQEWLQSGKLPIKYLGWHRADVMRELIENGGAK